MDLVKHPANERGHSKIDWLESFHSFSFAEYYNPQRMGFGLLRVLNDDHVQPGQGFATHAHQNMEIISIPLQGQLSHKDTLGNGSVISADEVQLMSAGKGIQHSEYNYSDTNKVNFLQLWIIPNKKNLSPSYQQKHFASAQRHDRLQSLVSPDGRDGSLLIQQNAYIARIQLSMNKQIEYKLNDANNGVYIFLIAGRLNIAQQIIETRDAVAVMHTHIIPMVAEQPSDVLIIEVAQNNSMQGE